MLPKYSILVPVFNEEEVVELFYETMTKTIRPLNEEYEIVFVNDGSKDKSLEILTSLAKKDSRVKVINFSRNFGQQAAELAALSYAKGEAVIIMDVDLQDPPEVILQLIKKYEE